MNPGQTIQTVFYDLLMMMKMIVAAPVKAQKAASSI